VSATLTLTDLRGVPFVGVRAALSGGVPDRVYQLYARRPMAAGIGTPTGAEVSADGAGNGAADVPLADADGGVGAWGLFAVGPATSGPFWGAASAAGDDIWVQVIWHLVARLLTENLPGVGESVMVLVEELAIHLPTVPCLIVGLSRMAETPDPNGPTGSDYWTFPLRLSFWQTGEVANSPGLWVRFLNWRGAIRRRLHNQRLGGLPGEVKVTCEPQFAVMPAPNQAGAITSIMTVKCQTRLVRG
jgi:hypothetical protein